MIQSSERVLNELYQEISLELFTHRWPDGQGN